MPTRIAHVAGLLLAVVVVCGGAAKPPTSQPTTQSAEDTISRWVATLPKLKAARITALTKDLKQHPAGSDSRKQVEAELAWTRKQNPYTPKLESLEEGQLGRL